MNCPRFDYCNAPLCPINPGQKDRAYLRGEPVCIFMLEYVKPDGQAKLKRTIGGRATEAVGKAAQWAKRAHKPFQERLSRASRTASRLGGA